MNRLDNKTRCLICLILWGLMLTGCTTRWNKYVEMRLDTPPPDDLVSLLDNPKRMIRIFSLHHSFEPDGVEYHIGYMLRHWNAGSSESWPGYTVNYRLYQSLKGTGYAYKDYYLFQLHSEEKGIIPMAILVPKDQGIIVLVNPYDPDDGIPWEFDHYTPHRTDTE